MKKGILNLVILSLILISFFQLVSAITQDSDLVLYLPLDSNMSDVSGNGNNAFCYGQYCPVHITGIKSNAFNFTGDRYLLVNNSESLNIKDSVSISLWLKLNSKMKDYNINTEKYQIIIEKSDNLAQNRSYGIWISGKFNSLSFSGSNTAGTDFVFFIGSNNSQVQKLDDLQWHHIVGVWDGNEAKLYVDRVVVANQIVSGNNPLYVSSGPLAIGRSSNNSQTGWSPNYYLNGQIDELRIYKSPINENTISALYSFSTGVCNDTDKGKNYTIKGSVVDGVDNYTDFCRDEQILNEFFCTEDKIVDVEFHNCSSGYKCSDGKCIKLVLQNNTIDDGTQTPPECTENDEDCDGKDFLLCTNGKWNAIGEVPGKCGVSEENNEEPNGGDYIPPDNSNKTNSSSNSLIVIVVLFILAIAVVIGIIIYVIITRKKLPPKNTSSSGFKLPPKGSFPPKSPPPSSSIPNQINVKTSSNFVLPSNRTTGR